MLRIFEKIKKMGRKQTVLFSAVLGAILLIAFLSLNSAVEVRLKHSSNRRELR